MNTVERGEKGTTGRWLGAALILLASSSPPPAAAALTQAQLAAAATTPRVGTAVPLDIALADRDGRTQTLGRWIGGRPALLLLSDYRCTQLCGPILAIAARALAGSGLSPDRDFTLIVAGFNPAAAAADGDRLRAAELGAYPDLDDKALVLTGAEREIGRLETAVGFTAVPDPEAQRFAHPADLFVLTAGGSLSRVLDGLSAEPDAVRLALVEAGQGRIGTVRDRLRLLCYGLGPATGLYDAAVGLALRIGAGLTLAAFAAFALLGLRRRRPRGPA